MTSIVVSELAYAPPGADPLFYEVSFGVAPGEHAALVGANGVGKSTILRILSGQLQPEDGEFAIGGTMLHMTQDVGMSRPDDTVREMLLQVAPALLRTVASHLSPPNGRWQTAVMMACVMPRLWRIGVITAATN
jgi:ATPase subunit of ABC transporter with duplicated ATPase domains